MIGRAGNPKVDAYVERSDRWPDVVAALRPVLVGAGLDEHLKWGKPCYVHDGKNVAIVQEMNDVVALMFFKGALLADPDGVLEEQGPNSRSARRMRFTSVDDVTPGATPRISPPHRSGEAGQDPPRPYRPGHRADPRRQGPPRPLSDQTAPRLTVRSTAHRTGS